MPFQAFLEVQSASQRKKVGIQMYFFIAPCQQIANKENSEN